MAAETGIITSAEMAKVREVDFVTQFAHKSLENFLSVIGVTRRIPMMEGTTLYVYATSGTLEDGEVDEGDIIPLSQYETTKTAVGDITLKKWRKAASAEAIKKSGEEFRNLSPVCVPWEGRGSIYAHLLSGAAEASAAHPAPHCGGYHSRLPQCFWRKGGN